MTITETHPMSAVPSTIARTASGLVLAESPRQHFWFEPSAPVSYTHL